MMDNGERYLMERLGGKGRELKFKGNLVLNAMLSSYVFLRKQILHVY